MNKLWGIFFGLLSAVSYATNPVFGVPLIADGFGVDCMLALRFSGAFALLIPVFLIARIPFKINFREGVLLAAIGALFAFSAETLFWTFSFMPAGIACTILFLYPVFVALIMALCFGERIGWHTIGALALSFAGIAVLSGFDVRQTNILGMALVILSALSYAIYMVIVKVTRLNSINGFTLTFYSLLFSAVALFAKMAIWQNPIQFPSGENQIFNMLGLIIVPTFVSITAVIFSIRYAGPVVAAILGAFEPAAAVLFCSLFLGEKFTLSLGVGVVLIIGATALLVFENTSRNRN